MNPPLLKTVNLLSILGAVDQQGTVKSPPTVAPREKKAKKKRLPLLKLLNLLLLVQKWIQRLQNLMKNGPTDSIGWKHFCWPGLSNRPIKLMLK